MGWDRYRVRVVWGGVPGVFGRDGGPLEDTRIGGRRDAGASAARGVSGRDEACQADEVEVRAAAAAAAVSW